MFRRRDFIKFGGVGASIASLGINPVFANQDTSPEKSVVWVWLGGGATQFETFHAPTDNVPQEYKPVSGLPSKPTHCSLAIRSKQRIPLIPAAPGLMALLMNMFCEN